MWWDEMETCRMCGSGNLRVESEVKYGDRGLRGQEFCVVCNLCGAQGAWADTEESAVKAWNAIEG